MRAVVTGAASGIGKATALVLAQEAFERGETAHLCMVDRAAEQLEAAAAEVRATGAQVIASVQDLSDLAAGDAIAALAHSAMGGLDVLISNAGVFGPGLLTELSIEDYELSFAVNTRATWLLARACHPMLKASRGAIVATASLSAEAPTPNTGAYCPSKAALVMLVRQMAYEWGPDGIRCNCVSPGTIHTGMNDAVYAEDGARRRREELVPLRRIGGPEDVARTIAFLAGPHAGYVTGVNIAVDGGLELSLMSHFWRLAQTPQPPLQPRP